VPTTRPEGTFDITRSLPHGHVAAVLGVLRQLDLETLIDPVPSRARNLVIASRRRERRTRPAATH